ncbi:hypothetical protein FF1_020315 [Malus domestica]
MMGCKPVNTPITEKHYLGIYLDQKPIDKGRYQGLVGRLIYLSHTRPDIAYVSTLGKVLYEHHGHMRIEGFTDADWASDVIDRQSTSRYFTFVEAKYKGMAHGVCEILWLRKLLWGLGFKQKEAMKLYCDNKSAREIAKNPVQHDRTKHVEVDRHFIKEKLEKKIVSIPFVNSEEQLADILTHVVCSRRFDDSLIKLGMCNIYAPI